MDQEAAARALEEARTCLEELQEALRLVARALPKGLADRTAGVIHRLDVERQRLQRLEAAATPKRSGADTRADACKPRRPRA